MALHKLTALEHELEALLLFDDREFRQAWSSKSFTLSFQTHCKKLDAIIESKRKEIRLSMQNAESTDVARLLDLSFTGIVRCYLCERCSDQASATPDICPSSSFYADLRFTADTFFTCQAHHLTHHEFMSERLQHFFRLYHESSSFLKETLETFRLLDDLPQVAKQNPNYINEYIIFHAILREDNDDLLQGFADGVTFDLLGRTWLHQVLDVLPLVSEEAQWTVRIRELARKIQQTDEIYRGINRSDGMGRTVLHAACQRGYTSIATALLSKGADPMHKARAGLSPLHFAAASGSLDICAGIVRRVTKDDVCATDMLGKKPIDYAFANKHFEVARLLSSASSTSFLDQPYHRWSTPLIKAITRQDIQLIEQLLLVGDDVNRKIESTSRYHKISNALTEALWPPNEMGIVIADLLVEKGAAIDAQLDNGKTALHIFARAQEKEVVEYLIRKGANLNQRDDEGRTVLMHACRSNRWMNHRWTQARLTSPVLLNKAFDRWGVANMTDYWGRTALDHAREWENSEAVTLLEPLTATR
jgi:ankyrin repeat protein